MTVISKAALAAELGVSKARVSQYVARGLPVRSDGKLDREAAVKWVADNHANYESPRTPGVNRAVSLTRRSQAKQPTPRTGNDQLLGLALLVLRRLNPIIATTAVDLGFSCPEAYALQYWSSYRISDDLEEYLNRFGHQFDARFNIFEHLGRDDETHWAALAQRTGDKLDVDGWSENLQELE